MMALKRWVAASIVVGVLLGTTGCSGARSILRGQSPESGDRAVEESAARERSREEFREKAVRAVLFPISLVAALAVGWLGTESPYEIWWDTQGPGRHR